ncbi:MAG: DUF3168 domain-containing protein [Bacteroidales bacterium]|nr:DUF3168 domain-containing protein [Bacteroidales bacterium]MBD5235140.1 DUF3168 domain-containing protein [Barnesiella sp.]
MPKKVFPLIAPAKTDYPFIIYRRSGVTVSSNKDYSGEDTARIEVITAAVNYDESIKIAEDIREALEHKRGKVNGLIIEDIELIQADESYLSDAYVQKLTFNIKLKL